MRAILATALLLLSGAAHAQIITINENLDTSTSTFYFDTNTPRLDVATDSYTGGIPAVALFVGSNAVVGTGTGASNQVVIYATGSVMALGVRLSSGPATLGISTGAATDSTMGGSGTSSNPLGVNFSTITTALAGKQASFTGISSACAAGFYLSSGTWSNGVTTGGGCVQPSFSGTAASSFTAVPSGSTTQTAFTLFYATVTLSLTGLYDVEATLMCNGNTGANNVTGAWAVCYDGSCSKFGQSGTIGAGAMSPSNVTGGVNSSGVLPILSSEVSAGSHNFAVSFLAQPGNTFTWPGLYGSITNVCRFGVKEISPAGPQGTTGAQGNPGATGSGSGGWTSASSGSPAAVYLTTTTNPVGIGQNPTGNAASSLIVGGSGNSAVYITGNRIYTDGGFSAGIGASGGGSGKDLIFYGASEAMRIFSSDGSIHMGTTTGTQIYRCAGGTDAGWILYGSSGAAQTLCTGGGGTVTATGVYLP